MTTVYFVRHCESEGNLNHIAQGHMDGQVTERGKLQIAALQKRFEGVHVDAVYSSDLIRARTTARAVYVPKNLPIHLDPSFREINLGPWEGQSWDELRVNDAENLHNFNFQMEKWDPRGGESPRDVINRFYPALMKAIRDNAGKTIAVFSHGCALRIMLNYLHGRDIDGIGDTPHGDNTAVSLLTFDGEKPRFIYENDNSHLVEAGLTVFDKEIWWRKKP